jgi:hypothetical protein
MPTIIDSNGVEIGYGDTAIAKSLIETARNVLILGDSTWTRDTLNLQRAFYRAPRIRTSVVLDLDPGLGGAVIEKGGASSILTTQNYSPYGSAYEQPLLSPAAADTAWHVNRVAQCTFRAKLRTGQNFPVWSANADTFNGSLISMVNANGGRVTVEYLAYPGGETQSILFFQVLDEAFNILATSTMFSTYAAANEYRSISVEVPSGGSAIRLLVTVRQEGGTTCTSGAYLPVLAVRLEDVSTLSTNLHMTSVSYGGEDVPTYLSTSNFSNGAWARINALNLDCVIVALGINGFADISASTWESDCLALVAKIRATNANLPIIFTSETRLESPPSLFVPTLKDVVDATPNSILIETHNLFPAHSVLYQGWTAAWVTGSAYRSGDVVMHSGVMYCYRDAAESTTTTAPSSDAWHPVDNPTGKWVALAGSLVTETTTTQAIRNMVYGDSVHPHQLGQAIYGKIIWDAISYAAGYLTGTASEIAAATVAAIKADSDLGTTGLIADAATAATEIVKVPRATSSVTAGGAVTRNIVGGEEIDEVIQGNA